MSAGHDRGTMNRAERELYDRIEKLCDDGLSGPDRELVRRWQRRLGQYHIAPPAFVELLTWIVTTLEENQ